MYVVLKNGKHFAEIPTYQAACREAREDADKYRGNNYTIWEAETLARPIRSQHDRPLYRIDGIGGVARYIIRNPPGGLDAA